METSSSQSQPTTTFVWQDYLLFVLSLLMNVAIGLYFTIKDRKKFSNEEFLMAGRSMSILPVAASKFATIVSSIAFVALPVEVYHFGMGYVFFVLGNCLCVFPIAEVFIPAYHSRNLVSAFQFLEDTFNPTLRKLAAIIQIFLMFMVMGMMTYAPSVSLAQVSGINVWTGIVITTAVCTFYTTLGGMKAIVWVDTLQMFLIFVGVALLAWKALADLGGWAPAMDIIREGGRLDTFNWSPNPFVRSSVWSYLLGGFFQGLIPLSSNQLAIQRYGTLRTVREAKICAYMVAPIYFMLGLVILLSGLAMYGHFAGCDPLMSGRVVARDQYVSLLVMKVLGPYPGLSGLYIAGIFAASLSTLSSGQNAIAANVLSDMIEPWYKRKHGREMKEKTAFIIAKCIAFGVGLLVMCSSFLTVAMGGNLFPLLNRGAGIFAGPLAGVFTIGVVLKSIRNVKVIIVSFFSATVVLLWLGAGALMFEFDQNHLSLSTEDCPVPGDIYNNTIDILNTVVWKDQEETTPPLGIYWNRYVQPTGFARVYNLSPLYYGMLGYCLTIGISFIADRICKAIKKCRGDSSQNELKKEKRKYDEDLKTDPVSLTHWRRKSEEFTKIDLQHGTLEQPIRESCL